MGFIFAFSQQILFAKFPVVIQNNSFSLFSQSQTLAYWKLEKELRLALDKVYLAHFNYLLIYLSFIIF